MRPVYNAPAHPRSLVSRLAPAFGRHPLLAPPFHPGPCPHCLVSRLAPALGRHPLPAPAFLPGPMAYPPPAAGQWSTGLCGCFSDCGSCCCSFCCPCVVVGRLVEIVDQGVTSCLSAGCLFYWLQSCTGCGFLYTCGYRSRLRAKYGLAPEPCGDCCSDYWCLPCSLAQQYRELKNRGVDPATGWAANRVAYEQSAPAQQKMQY